MTTWKQAIDKEKEEKQRKAAEKECQEREKQARRYAAEQKQRREEEAREQAAYARKLEELGRRFHCHIRGCGYKAQQPAKKRVKTGRERYRYPSSDSDAWFGWYDETTQVDDWGNHADPNLKRCSRCGNWTCAQHLHRGICQECGEKLAKKKR